MKAQNRGPDFISVDGGEGDGLDGVLCGQGKAVLIAVGQEAVFVVLSAPPDGAGGVDDVLGREIVCPGNFGFSRSTASKGLAFCQKGWPCRPVNGAVDAPAAEQGCVGGIDNRIYG